MDLTKQKIIIYVGVGIGLSAFVATKVFRNWRREPKVWKKVGTLEEITYFPLRSCSGIALDQGLCGQFGIKEGHFHDRIFQLVDVKSGEIGFAGKRPKLYEIKTERVDDNILKVTADGMEELIIDVQEIEQGKEYYHNVYGFIVPLLDCGKKYDVWFSRFLLGNDTGLKLSMSRTPVVKRNWFKRPKKVNFYMVTTTSSLEDLNSRLENPVSNRNFRGNLMIKTEGLPYAEDDWKWMKIGDAVFKWNAPCYRCILTNVDPITAQRSKDFEPFKTLKKFRMRKGEKEPIFGTYFDAVRTGVVKKGDDVFVGF